MSIDLWGKPDVDSILRGVAVSGEGMIALAKAILGDSKELKFALIGFHLAMVSVRVAFGFPDSPQPLLEQLKKLGK